MVSSADETVTAEDVLTQLRVTVEAKEEWTKVERVLKARDKKGGAGVQHYPEMKKS